MYCTTLLKIYKSKTVLYCVFNIIKIKKLKIKN